MSTSALVAELLRAEDIEGVTMLGGEPFDQADALADVAEGVQARGKSVMTFTGHTLEELRSSSPLGVTRLLEATDLLVDGRYDREKPDYIRPWVGSTNQRFHFLSARYSQTVDVAGETDRLEVHLASDGTITVNGFATADVLDELLEGLGKRPASR